MNPKEKTLLYQKLIKAENEFIELQKQVDKIERIQEGNVKQAQENNKLLGEIAGGLDEVERNIVSLNADMVLLKKEEEKPKVVEASQENPTPKPLTFREILIQYLEQRKRK